MNTKEVHAVQEGSIPSGKQPKGLKASQIEESGDNRHPSAPVGTLDPNCCWWHHVCFSAARQGEPY
jgi:hypothetical protein